MTSDDIIKLAHKAQFEGFGNGDWVCTTEEIERFAALVAAAEREACIDLVAFYGGPVDLEAAIRARRNT